MLGEYLSSERVPWKHSLVGSASAASSQVIGPRIDPNVPWARIAATSPSIRPKLLASENPNKLAFAPASRTGGIHDAWSASPNGNGNPIRGRGKAKSRSVFSGPLPGRQMVAVAVAGSTLGR